MSLYWVNPSRPPRRAKLRGRIASAARKSTRSVPKFMSLSEFEARASKKSRRARKARPTKNPKKRGKKMAKLFGAALKARKKRLAKLARRRGRKANPAKRRRRRNPRRRTSFATRMGSFKLNPRRKRRAVRRGRRRKNPFGGLAQAIQMEAKSGKKGKALKKWRSAQVRSIKSKAKGRAARAKKFLASLSPAQRKRAKRLARRLARKSAWYNQGIFAGGKKLSSRRKRKAAAKKRRASSKKSTTKKGKRKSAKRVAAGKKAWRTRRAKKARRAASKGKSMARKGKKGRVRRRRFRGRFRGVFTPSLLKARRSIKRGRSRKYGSKRSRRTIRHFGLRVRNPVGSIMAAVKGAVKAALPVVGGYVGTRLVINKVGGMILSKLPIPARLQGPAMSILGVVAAHYATSKIGPLKKHRAGIMVGAGINLVQTLFAEFAPASVKGFLGVGDVYEQALAEYVETGDYVETGMEQDLAGMEQDLAGPMIGPVPSHPMLGPVARGHGAVGPVRDFTPADMEGLYTGNFAGKKLW